LLLRAGRDRLKVSIAGARHSMGGHTLSPDGITIDMLPFNGMSLSEDGTVLHVGAGARWAEVIPYLDARGKSVAVMQSNNNFSVGGSVSVNCHGWQLNRPPIASTVVSFRLMTADGVVRRCSREENRDLFSHALGGYGLFGVILDLDLRVVPNERYRPELDVLPASRFAEHFAERVADGADVGMALGRLCVTPGEETFLREATFAALRKAPCETSEIPALRPLPYQSLRRDVYRAQIGSDAGKELRWWSETTIGKRFTKQLFSRNQLLNEDADVFREHNADRTDILHEYFVPPEGLNAFLDRARTVIPDHRGDLLNVTIRDVAEDTDTVLRYADRRVFALVMLFNMPRTDEADERMRAMTRDLVDAALAAGGRYYLPYRLHATPDQFARAYPKAGAFFDRKRHYDPGELFSNRLYETYGRPAGQ
jgi:FAD/FMN-containing dehydrogenase